MLIYLYPVIILILSFCAIAHLLQYRLAKFVNQEHALNEGEVEVGEGENLRELSIFQLELAEEHFALAVDNVAVCIDEIAAFVDEVAREVFQFN